MALTKSEIAALYQKRSRHYDISANLYYLLGFREARYRKMAVKALNLKRGDRVVEIGCGTGLNFGYVLEQIGGSGNLIGVDLSEAMLEQAKKRVRRNHWTNVELIRTDAARYELPHGLSGVISTFALTLVPEYETIIKRAAEVLNQDGRFVILDLKKPDRWPLWLVKLGVLLSKPFGVSYDLADRKPWLVMQKYFGKVMVTDIFGGFAYVAIASKD